MKALGEVWGETRLQKASNPGTKYDAGKPGVDLIPPAALLEIAKVLNFGAAKYGKWNWAEGIYWSRLLGAALRHIYAWSMGEAKDPETNLSHLAHSATCLLFLIHYESYKKEFDDRYIPVVTSSQEHNPL